MNFEDESYVRLYIRRTATNRRLGWEGRALMHEMLYEFDRAGVWEFDEDPIEDLALITGLPPEVVRVGLQRLLSGASPTWTMGDHRIVWPRYVDGQNCAKSDRIRQRESRSRRRDEAIESSHDVTSCHELSRPSQASRNVTPSLADPNLAKPSQAEPRKGTSPSAPAPEVPAPVKRVFDHWRSRLNHSRAVLDSKRERCIRARLKEFSADDLCKAIDGCLKSDFHMGRDPNSRGVHDDITLICRDASHVEKFIRIDNGQVPNGRAGPQRGGSQRDQTMQFLAEEHRLALEREAQEEAS